MCKVITKIIDNPDGTMEAQVTCEISGKSITITNEYGVFCEDLCELEECKKGFHEMKDWIDIMVKRFFDF
jgi:hypothetical protein